MAIPLPAYAFFSSYVQQETARKSIAGLQAGIIIGIYMEWPAENKRSFPCGCFSLDV